MNGNPCIYTAAAPTTLDLSVHGSLISSGTALPAGLMTHCRHRPGNFFTVQDAAGQSMTVGYDLAAGAQPPSLASLVGQTVSLRVRLAPQFQIDTDSVGFALQDSAGGLVVAVYGGIFHIGQGDAKLAPADLQGINVTSAEPDCFVPSACGSSIYYALRFSSPGDGQAIFGKGTTGTVYAGGTRYRANHVATLDLVTGCGDMQDWQGWSLVRDDL